MQKFPRLLQWLFPVVLLFAVLPSAAQRLTDIQMTEYIRQRHEQGAKASAIANELLARGATADQLQRIQRNMEKLHMEQKGAEMREEENDDEVEPRINNGEKAGTALSESQPATRHDAGGRKIFGHDIFRSRMLSFEPNVNVAVPDDYVLGAGDEIDINVNGASHHASHHTISPEGVIVLDLTGPVTLAGQTLSAARRTLKARLSPFYSGSTISVNVGQTRSIGIHVMGEVAVPGSYTLSAFATVFHALYVAGGVGEIGTLRAIKVVRGGRIVANVDIYDYILHGRLSGNIMLRDGDVIIVGPYEQLVEMRGEVKRPMWYEVRAGESLQQALESAGMFSEKAHRASVRVERRVDSQRMVFTPSADDFATFLLTDGDVVTADSSATHYVNMAEVKGAVVRPGRYEISAGMGTVMSLVTQAGGLLPEAVRDHAVLLRQKADGTHEAISVDIDAIFAGSAPDIPLHSADALTVASLREQIEQRYLTIEGEVAMPGRFPYADNMTVKDLVILAGGMLETASLQGIEVARRVKVKPEEDGKEEGRETMLYTLHAEAGNQASAQYVGTFCLQPYDEVFVRRHADYNDRWSVSVRGEVNYAGRYVLTSDEERLSDVMKRTGGFTSKASIADARLVRKMNEEEYLRRKTLLDRSRHSADSLNVEIISLSDTYNVAIDLKAAMDRPGSDDDIVLRDGDEIVIPQHSSTVTVSGEVMHPNAVTYAPGKDIAYYINQAGGYSQDAQSRKSYIIYNNGAVSRASKGKVMPGCEIVVPTRHRRNNTRSLSTSLSVTTALATVAAVLVTALK